jgi:GT2 family glycosyltransferase
MDNAQAQKVTEHRLDHWHYDHIDVVMPYEPGMKLAYAYNRAMQLSAAEWVLFLDHDLFICNRWWYEMCMEAIRKAPDNCGWITAVTNRIGNKNQKAVSRRGLSIPDTEDVGVHCQFSHELYKDWGTQLLRCRGAMSGFFILTNKAAWRAAGGFDENRKRLAGVDNIYSRDLNRAGYCFYKLPGLYFYHMYRKKNLYMRW